MCSTIYRRTGPPGPVGWDAGAAGQLPSWLHANITWGDLYPRAKGAPKGGVNEVYAARIYFSTSEIALGPDDRKVLHDFAITLEGWLLHGAIVEVRCEGYADMRGEVNPNEELSLRRAESVARFLMMLFKGAPGVKFIPVRGRGTTGSSDSRILAESRRVDVYVHFQSPWEVEHKNNPYNRYRANIFKMWYPHYLLWAERGLDYLVDQYEQDDSVEIKQADYSKVMDLMSKLAALPKPEVAASDLHKLEITISAGSPGKNQEAITNFYEVEYRNAYEKALSIFEDTYLRFSAEHPEIPYEDKIRIVSSGFREH